MNDPKLLRRDPESARTAVKNRGGRHLPVLEEYLEGESRHRALLAEVEEMRAKRNESSKAVGKAKGAGDEDAAARLMGEVGELKKAMAGKEAELAETGERMKGLLLGIPNLPDASVPVGSSESDNRPVRDSGPVPDPRFGVLDHAALGEKRGLIDFAAATKLSGARFSILKGPGARLHRVLGQFMLDVHAREHGYAETWVPQIVLPEILEGTGQLPKFEEDLFRTGDSFLIPTAEVPLTNLVRGEILDAAALPLKFTALTACFRQEAGSYGKDVRGLIRQHQFEKVELVWVVEPESSMDALEDLTLHAENILKLLKLPYRIIELCTADLGFSAAKTYDLEVWMPGEKRWREVSSCSNCKDFQARRMNARFRRGPKGAPQFVHTLNGSGLAVGRIFAAILENYQQPDGTVIVPEVLRPSFGSSSF